MVAGTLNYIKAGYKPDFSLLIAGKKSDVVIEHWGIDENNERRKTPDHWGITWDEYRETMNRKRKYWETYNSNKPLEPVAHTISHTQNL